MSYPSIVRINNYSVNNVTFVKIGESEKTATRDRSQVVLIQSISLPQIRTDGSAMAVLHDDLVFTKRLDPHPEFIVVMDDTEVFDDEFGGAFFECFGFLLDLFGIGYDFGFLDGNKIIRRFIEC